MGRETDLARVGLAHVDGVGAVEIHLTDYQERALIELVDFARGDRDGLRPRAWHRAPRRQTAERLARLGLIEYGPVSLLMPDRMVARATDAGIVLCDSMGD